MFNLNRCLIIFSQSLYKLININKYLLIYIVLLTLYDLNKDPHEMNNLLGINPNKKQYEQKAEELRSCLLEWLQKNNSKHYNGVLKRKLI